ncbi:MAG: FtsX-like permease family protein [Myxococcota bacterium]
MVDVLWKWLSAGGGTLALSFIVALALGIVALTVFYLGSAVVVLERFARAAKHPLRVVIAAVLASLAMAAASVRVVVDEAPVLSWGDWLWELVPAWGWAAVVTGVVCAVVWAALRWLAPAALGRAALVWLGLAVSLWLGSAANPGFAAVPLVAVGGCAAIFAWRRRTSDRGPGELERLARWLGAALAPAPLVALALGEPSVDLQASGTGLVGLFFTIVGLGLLPLAAAGLFDLRRSVEWFIATRYLVAKRRQVFISAITGICVAGIAAGVWLIIVVMSVMNGFEKTWRDEIVGNRAHFTVHHGYGSFGDYGPVLEVVRGTEGVVGASPYLDAEGMVRGSGGQIFSVRVRGIDPRSVGDVTDLSEDLISGSLGALVDPGSGNGAGSTDPGIVIGNQLAVSMNVAEGDSLLLISPYGGPPTPLGPAPRLKRFTVVGVFESSFFQYDEVYTYVDLPAAQDFRKAGDVIDGIEARTTDFYRSQRVADDVRNALDYPYYTRDWKEFFPAFFQALKTERVMMFILLMMIMVVAAFVIVATLIMMIMEKSADIAILKAMGAEDATIERIFALEGTLIGLVGTAIGVVAGVAVTKQLWWIQEQVERVTGIDTLPASVYQFSRLPSEIDPFQIALVGGAAMVFSLGATLLPSRQGSRLDPAESLRYE